MVTVKTLASYVEKMEVRIIYNGLVPISGGHFVKYWGDECQGPCKIYMSVPW